jgi:hypothetical protein
MNKDRDILKEGASQLEKALTRLESSYNTCRQLDFGTNISDEKLKELESLSARFARAVDLFTQKVLKSFFIILGEELLTFRDRINFTEKLKIIESAEMWLVIRSVRNQIVHDYVEEDLIAHHQQILDLCLIVDKEIKSFLQYIKKEIINNA